MMCFNKIHATLFLLFLAVISICSQCKDLDCREQVFSFEIGIKAYPDKDSIRVNDTIWLEVNEQTTLKDLQTGSIIDFSGAANLGSAIGFKKYSSVTGQFTTDAVEKFNFYLIKGTEVPNRTPSLYKEYFFAEENGYVFRLGVIPKETGTFVLVFSNATSVVRKRDNCTKASFVLNFKKTNQHYYLNPNFVGGPVAPGGDYYFKVY